jgi:hypothetical protein
MQLKKTKVKNPPLGESGHLGEHGHENNAGFV